MRRDRISLPSTSRTPSVSDFNGTLHLQRAVRESRATRQFSLVHNINVSSRSLGFIVYSIARYLEANYIPGVIARVKSHLWSYIMEVQLISNKDDETEG